MSAPGAGEGISWIDVAASAAGILSQMQGLGTEAKTAMIRGFQAQRGLGTQAGQQVGAEVKQGLNAGLQGMEGILAQRITAGLQGSAGAWRSQVQSMGADVATALDAPLNMVGQKLASKMVDGTKIANALVARELRSGINAAVNEMTEAAKTPMQRFAQNMVTYNTQANSQWLSNTRTTMRQVETEMSAAAQRSAEAVKNPLSQIGPQVLKSLGQVGPQLRTNLVNEMRAGVEDVATAGTRRFEQMAPQWGAKFGQIGKQMGDQLSQGASSGLGGVGQALLGKLSPQLQSIVRPFFGKAGIDHGKIYHEAVTEEASKLGGKMTPIWEDVSANMAGRAAAAGAASGAAMAVPIVGAAIAAVEIVKTDFKTALNILNTEAAQMGKIGKDAADTMMGGFVAVLNGKMPDVMGAFNVMEEGMRSLFELPFTGMNAAIDATVGHIPILGDTIKTVMGEAEQAFGAFFFIFDEFKELSGTFVEEVLNIGDEWQETARKIAGQTLGKENLEDYLGIVRNIAASGDLVHFKDVADIVGELGQRLSTLGGGAGLSNDQLEELTKTIAEGNEVLGDYKINVDLATAALNDFNIAPEKTAEEMRTLINISRLTGADFNAMVGDIDRAGPSLDALGYSMDDAAMMMGKFNQELGKPAMSRMIYGLAQVEEKLKKAGFDDVREGWQGVIDTVNKYNAVGEHAAAVDYMQQFVGSARTAETVVDGISKNIVSVADVERLMGENADALHEPFDEVLDSTKSLQDSLEQLQNQAMAAFGQIGLPLVKGLNEASDHLRNWMQENQDRIIHWGAVIMDKIMSTASAILQDVGATLVATAPMINNFKNFILANLKILDAALQATLKPFTILPDMFGGKMFRQMSKDLQDAMGPLNDMIGTDIAPTLEGAGKGLEGLGRQLDAARKPFAEYAAGAEDAAKINERFLATFSKEKGDKADLQNALGADKEGLRLLGDKNTWAQVAEQLNKIGIHVDYDKESGKINSFTTETKAEADALSKYLKERLGDKTWEELSPKIAPKFKNEQLTPDQVRDKLGLPSEIQIPTVPGTGHQKWWENPQPAPPPGKHWWFSRDDMQQHPEPPPPSPPPYGQMPGNLGPGGILSRAHGSGYLQIPGQIALQPAGATHTIGEVLDSAGIPLGSQDIDGSTIPGGGVILTSGLNMTTADPMDGPGLMSRAGVPEKYQGDIVGASPGVTLPTAFDVRDPHTHKTVGDMLDAAGIPSELQGSDGIKIPVGFNVDSSDLSDLGDSIPRGGGGGGRAAHGPQMRNVGSFKGFGSAEGWRPTVKRVVAQYGGQLGIPEEAYPAWEDAIVKQIVTESQGDPNAINKIDSNAIAGHPSEGLLQFIPSTYAAHNVTGLPFPDPVGEIAATLDYAPRTKDGWPAESGPGAIGRGHGFAAGGSVMAYPVNPFDPNKTGPPGPGSPAIPGEWGPSTRWGPHGAPGEDPTWLTKHPWPGWPGPPFVPGDPWRQNRKHLRQFARGGISLADVAGSGDDNPSPPLTSDTAVPPGAGLGPSSDWLPSYVAPGVGPGPGPGPGLKPGDAALPKWWQDIIEHGGPGGGHIKAPWWWVGSLWGSLPFDPAKPRLTPKLAGGIARLAGGGWAKGKHSIGDPDDPHQPIMSPINPYTGLPLFGDMPDMTPHFALGGRIGFVPGGPVPQAPGPGGGGELLAIYAACRAEGVDPDVWGNPLLTLIGRESGNQTPGMWEPDVTQHGYTDANTGGNEAVGAAQVTPGTARQYGIDPANLRNPVQNIRAAIRYIKGAYSGGKGPGVGQGGLGKNLPPEMAIFNVQQADPGKPPHGYQGGGHALFPGEGPEFYQAAYAHNRQFATASTSNYQTALSAAQERQFRAWVKASGAPFDPNAAIVDYDMRGFWLTGGAKDWHRGSHFPDTFKTPYDTTFSGESMYATKDNPFVWQGDNLVDRRTGQLIFGQGFAEGGGAWFGSSPHEVKTNTSVNIASHFAKFAEGGGAWFGSSPHETKTNTSVNLASHFAKFAGGGHVKGPLWAGRDSVPMDLPSGTFVVRRDRALKHRSLLDRVMSGGGDGHAAGSHKVVKAIVQPDERLIPPKIAAKHLGLLHGINSGRIGAQGGGILQVIWANPASGEQVGEADSQLVGPGTSQGGYYGNDWKDHHGHVHTSFGSGPNGEFYGLPVGTDIRQGKSGFPDWVYELGDQFGLEASTYAGHQEKSGYNRGIDWWPKGHSDMSGASYSDEERARLDSFAESLAMFGSGGAGGNPSWAAGAGQPGGQDAGYMRGNPDEDDYADVSDAGMSGGGDGSGGGGGDTGIRSVDFSSGGRGRVQLADYHTGGGGGGGFPASPIDRHGSGGGTGGGTGGDPGNPKTPAPTAPGGSYTQVPPPPGYAAAQVPQGTPGSVQTPFGTFAYPWDLPPDKQQQMSAEQRQNLEKWLHQYEQSLQRGSNDQDSLNDATDRTKQAHDKMKEKEDEYRKQYLEPAIGAHIPEQNLITPGMTGYSEKAETAHKAMVDAEEAYAKAVKAEGKDRTKIHDQDIQSRIEGDKPPPWVKTGGKGSKEGDKDAEELGKGLLKGIAQELGFPDVFGKPPWEWGIWKTAMKGLGFGASLLEGGGAAGGGGGGGGGGGSPLGGILGALIPGLGGEHAATGSGGGGWAPQGSVRPADPYGNPFGKNQYGPPPGPPPAAGGAPESPSAHPAMALSQAPVNTPAVDAGGPSPGGGGGGLSISFPNLGVIDPASGAKFVNSVISGSGTGSSQTATRGGQIGTVMA